MPLVRTNLIGETAGPGFGAGVFTSSAFTPPSSSLLVVAGVVMESSGTTDPSADLTVSGGGWTYTSRVVIGSTSSYSMGVKIWTAPVSTGASMTLAFDTAARVAEFYAVSVVAYTIYDTGAPAGATGTFVDTATPDGAQSLTLSSAPASDSEVFAALAMDKENIGATPGAAFTEIHDMQVGGFFGGLETEVRTGSTSTTVDWVDAHTGAGGIFKCLGVAVEIKSGVPLEGPGNSSALDRMGLNLAY